MDKEFDGKVAFVTGGGSGIGASVSRKFAERGGAVVVMDLNAETVKATVSAIEEKGGRATAFTGDVTKPEDLKAAVDLAISTYGRLDAALNNAGIGGPQGPIDGIDLDAYRQLMAVNLDSVFYGMQVEIPAMIATGGGSIVNTSSILGLVGTPDAIPYVTAKHGVVGMTRATALAYAPKGVRVNSVHPGYIETPLLSGIPQPAKSALIRQHPIGRLGTADEVAEVVLFLLSDRASNTTGSQYATDGGYTAQ